MKKLITLFSFVLTCSSLFAQAPITLESAEIAARVFDEASIPGVQGRLLNYDPKKDKDLFIKYVLVQLGPEMQVTKMAEIQEDGSFELSLDNALPFQQMWFSIGDHYYGQIMAHEFLEIEADLNKIRGKKLYWYGKGINFTGKDGELNRYINKYVAFKNAETEDIQKEAQMLMMDRKTDLKERIQRFREINEEMAKVEASFAEQEGSPYAWLLKNERLSGFYGELCLMHLQSGMDEELLQEVLAHQPAIVSNEGHLYYRYIGMMLRSFKTDEFLKKLANYPLEKRALIKLMAQPDDLYRRQSYLEKVLPEMEDHWAKKQMMQALEEDQKHISKIEESLKDSPPVEENSGLGINRINFGEHTRLYYSEEEEVESLLQSIRNSFEGKAIILDIWATWCGPCISDMKQSKQVKEGLKNLPVELVYICVEDGSSEKAWKKKVAELEVEGIHIFVNRNLNGKLMSYFKFNGYPSYVFIDQEGNVDLNYIHRISRINLEDLENKLSE